MKLASFDLEIKKELPEDCKDWREYRPLGISCAAVYAADTDNTVDPEYWTYDERSGDAVDTVVYKLQEYLSRGYYPLTWNGVGFDFDVLAEESGRINQVKALTLSSIDMMYMVVAIAGHYLGLEKALAGAGLKGKVKQVTLSNGTVLDGMSGALAPKLWSQGECDAVLTYLESDVVQPFKLARTIEKSKRIRWISRSGRRQSLYTGGLMTVRDCLNAPLPNRRTLVNREDVSGWLTRLL